MEIDRVEKGKGGHKGGKQGCHKGKKGEKGKGKGKEKGGKGKKGGKGGPPGGCYNCGGRHFVRDCPKGKGKRKNVNQVNRDQPTATAPPANNTSPTTPAPTTTRPTQPPTNSVRRVPLRTQTPPMSSDNDVVADFYDDFLEEPAVRAVSVRSQPRHNAHHRRPGQRGPAAVRDHRGQSFIIKETCVVGRVRVPLLVAGKLLKLVSEEDPSSTGGAGPRSMILRSPAGLPAPVAFKHNSLVVQGEFPGASRQRCPI
ncbi:dcl1 [Symbiodinium sp. CCMP2592]|nr:dcl1 [Symbiodinium sp. CCMP2592]